MTKAGPPGLRLAGGILLAIGLTIAVAAELRGWPAPDLEWLLHIAGSVLDGKRLYVDLLEVNPPLIVALNLPAVALGRALGVPPVTIYRIGVVAIAVMSLLLAARVLPFTTEADRVRCRRVVALLAAGFLIVPGLTFGQRDHLALILTAPYVLLRIAQALETPEPRWARLAAAGLAGVGLALKPHFLVFWLAVEAWSVAKRGRRPGRC